MPVGTVTLSTVVDAALTVMQNARKRGHRSKGVLLAELNRAFMLSICQLFTLQLNFVKLEERFGKFCSAGVDACSQGVARATIMSGTKRICGCYPSRSGMVSSSDDLLLKQIIHLVSRMRIVITGIFPTSSGVYLLENGLFSLGMDHRIY